MQKWDLVKKLSELQKCREDAYLHNKKWIYLLDAALFHQDDSNNIFNDSATDMNTETPEKLLPGKFCYENSLKTKWA